MEQVRALHLEASVTFIRETDYDQMSQLYSAADVVVSVQSSDGMSITLFESMACGRPNVVSRLPHYVELVQDGFTRCCANREHLRLRKRSAECWPIASSGAGLWGTA